MNTLDSTLQDIFRAIFDLPSDADPTQLHQGMTERWDSLGHVGLVTAIESEFGITLDAVDQIGMVSYDAVRQMLEHRGL